jgi:hypothetical protein
LYSTAHSTTLLPRFWNSHEANPDGITRNFPRCFGGDHSTAQSSKPSIVVIFWRRHRHVEDYPRREGADTLCMKKAVDEAMKKVDNRYASSN